MDKEIPPSGVYPKIFGSMSVGWAGRGLVLEKCSGDDMGLLERAKFQMRRSGRQNLGNIFFISFSAGAFSSSSDSPGTRRVMMTYLAPYTCRSGPFHSRGRKKTTGHRGPVRAQSSFFFYSTHRESWSGSHPGRAT